MNCLSPSVNKKLLVSRNSIREAQAKALDLFVGRGCRYSVKERKRLIRRLAELEGVL
jgi:hypothetical protein